MPNRFQMLAVKPPSGTENWPVYAPVIDGRFTMLTAIAPETPRDPKSPHQPLTADVVRCIWKSVQHDLAAAALDDFEKLDDRCWDELRPIVERNLRVCGYTLEVTVQDAARASSSM